MKNCDLPMRDSFFDELYNIATKDRNVILVSADCGAPSLDKYRENLRSQYINVGIAEQNMVAVSAGLALAGKIVFMYAIAPFVSLRCYEQIKVDLCCMNLNITAIGIGAGWGYDIMGPTHHATEDVAIMRALPGMTVLHPSDNVAAAAFAKLAYSSPGPKYVRLERGSCPIIHDEKDDFSDGLTQLKSGSDVCIITAGAMVHNAFTVADELAKHSIEAGIVDLYRIKPINKDLFWSIVAKSKRVVSLEENLLDGGMGSAIGEVITDSGKQVPLKRIGIPDTYCFEYGGRDRLHALHGLDVPSVTKTVLEWLR